MGTVQIDGSTPKITVGNATAEDATILFDGNAQDYYVGLDDSADTLVLGLGSALGTTPAITINSSQVATFAQNPVFPDGSLALADLDIDGGTDIGAAIVDADLFIVDDGAGGTNRKTTAARLSTYIDAASVMNDLTDVSMDITNFVDGLLIQTDTDGSAPGTGTLSSATGNIGIGKDVFAALTSGTYNVVLGYEAGKAITDATYNVVIGPTAGDAMNGGDRNIMLGQNSGGATTVGNDNIYIGVDAGLTVTTASQNIAIGNYAMDGATDLVVPNNMAIGVHAMSGALASSMTENVAVGNYSFQDMTTAKYSTALGFNAGMNVTTGFGNTCIGHQAGNGTITGDYNTFLGIGANGSANNTTRAIAIGQDVTAASNDFSFGKSGSVVTNDFDTDADWAQSSDERLKRNIEDSTLGLDFINDLRPRKFQWEPYSEVPEELRTNWEEGNEKNLDATMHGFIAQEVKTAIDTHGDTTFGGWQLDKVDGVTQRTKKNMFIMPLIKAVQELSAEVETLKAKVAVLEG